MLPCSLRVSWPNFAGRGSCCWKCLFHGGVYLIWSNITCSYISSTWMPGCSFSHYLTHCKRFNKLWKWKFLLLLLHRFFLMFLFLLIKSQIMETEFLKSTLILRDTCILWESAKITFIGEHILWGFSPRFCRW